MKKIIVYIILGLFGIILLANCNKSEEDNNNVVSSDIQVFNRTKEVAPNIQQSTTRNPVRYETWGNDNEVYVIFNFLQDYTHSEDNGIIDMSNIYKVLFETDANYASKSLEVVDLSAETELLPPFDFGNHKSYNQAKNFIAESPLAGGPPYGRGSIAVKKIETQIEAMFSQIWDPVNDNWGYVIVEYLYNETSKDLGLDMLYITDYTPSTPIIDNGFTIRTWISGNTETHAFKLKTIMTPGAGFGDIIKMVGMGISKGTDNNFLFKVQTQTGAINYYVIPADATEEEMKSITATPVESLPSSVDDYKTWVTDEPFFSATSDSIESIDSLNSGNSNQGTVYINGI